MSERVTVKDINDALQLAKTNKPEAIAWLTTMHHNTNGEQMMVLTGELITLLKGGAQ